MNEADRRGVPRFGRDRGPRRSHDDGCTVTRDGSRGMPGGSRLVRSQAEQHRNSERVAEMLDGAPGGATSTAAWAPNGSAAASATSSTIGSRRSKRFPIRTASSCFDDDAR